MNTKRWLMTASLMAPGCGATFEQLQARAALDLDPPLDVATDEAVRRHAHLDRGRALRVRGRHGQGLDAVRQGRVPEHRPAR
jgi:hypothetical protein